MQSFGRTITNTNAASGTYPLASSHCVPCSGNTLPLPEQRIVELCDELPLWELVQNSIVRNFTFKNFAEAIKFINSVSVIAEAEDHHPDIALTKYKNVQISWTSFAAKGLTENDFVMAAKVDQIFSAL